MHIKANEKNRFFRFYFLKKLLTNEKVCDIIVKLSPREIGNSETVIEN